MVLRPEPGASETKRKARARGVDAIPIPLFEIEPAVWKVPDLSRFDALLLTSANAVRFGGEALDALKTLPVHAVGAATADTARSAGFEVASAGDMDVDSLLNSLDPALKLLHLCGEHRSNTANASQQLTSLVVYRANEKATPRLRAVEGAVVLVHSPRAGRRLAELVQDRSSFIVAAISPAAALAVGSGWASVQAAETPTDDALLALAERLCNNPPG